jgi:hypothetical protein
MRKLGSKNNAVGHAGDLAGQVESANKHDGASAAVNGSAPRLQIFGTIDVPIYFIDLSTANVIDSTPVDREVMSHGRRASG